MLSGRGAVVSLPDLSSETLRAFSSPFVPHGKRGRRGHADVPPRRREQGDIRETRTIVASIAPQIGLAEIARSRHDESPREAARLVRRGPVPGGVQQRQCCTDAAANCRLPRGSPSTCLACGSRHTLVMAHYLCHLYRLGDQPEGALDRAWAVVERGAGGGQSRQSITTTILLLLREPFRQGPRCRS
jgi:hypothetical protein